MQRKAVRLPAVLLALAALLVGCTFGGDEAQEEAQPAAAAAQEKEEGSGAPGGAPTDQPVVQVANDLSPSVVQVNIRAVQVTPFGPREGEGVGSGVIYRSDGYIVTNNHVVAPPGGEDAEEVNIAFADGSTERGEVVGSDPSTDLAVVRVGRNGLPEATFAEGNDLDVGELAVAIGSPSGFQSTVTAGVISGINREVPARLTGGQQDRALVDLIQTDAPISPGSSGGVLAARDGRVVGVNVAYLPPDVTGAESIGFAIPSDTVSLVADQLIESGRVSNPFLGIRYRDLTPEVAEEFGLSAQTGILVAEAEAGSPAAEAGLQPEDVITAMGSTKIENSGDLLGALHDYRPGDTVTLTVIRGGSGGEEEVEVRLGEQ